MKGRGDAKVRRQEQPLPSRPMSPGSPQSYGRSPSRSRSPVGRPAKFARGPGSQQVKRPEQSYSTSGSSGDSPSGSSSSSEGGQRPAAKPQARHAPQSAPQPARKKHATGSKKGDRELIARINDLEDQLNAERGAREELAAKSSFLTEKVRSVAERSKARGSMLIRLLGASRKVQEAKLQVEEAQAKLADAEAELKRVTEDVTAAVAEENAPAGPASARDRGDAAADGDARSLAAARSGQLEASEGHNQGMNGQQMGGGMASAMVVDAQDNVEDASAGAAGGGWQEVQEMGQGGAAGKFKPFKFSIKL